MKQIQKLYDSKSLPRQRFILNEAGAEIESKSEIVVSVEAHDDDKKPKPKIMIFDNPFLTLLKRTDAKTSILRTIDNKHRIDGKNKNTMEFYQFFPTTFFSSSNMLFQLSSECFCSSSVPLLSCVNFTSTPICNSNSDTVIVTMC